MPSWNPDLYLAFANERTQPSRDLAARVPLEAATSILDIGCGPGNSTGVIAGRYPMATTVLGIDSSPEMIEKAAACYPAYQFRQWDAGGDLTPLGCFDVVFSNACIQWLPNHEALLPHMMGCVAKGGALAIQVPVNQNAPVHLASVQLAGSKKYREYISPRSVFTRLSPEEYYDILAHLSQSVQIWQTTYYHTMENHEAILHWYQGTGLRPYLDALPPALAGEFLPDMLQEIRQGYPVQKNGSVLFPFPRLFMVATK